MEKKVTVIEATQKNEVLEEANLRVCAYCRVSSMHEDQQNSFAAQVTYYTEYISKNSNWIFAGIYADEGISGTSKEKRVDFLRLIKDCEYKMIDFIITKSISRFARNTADCIEIVRKLKALGVGVYFEKENINTLSQESELILSVLSSIAQEESSSLSTNIRWSNQKKFSQGIFHRPTGKLLGYQYDETVNNLVIVPDEAVIIKRIFKEYIGGKGALRIARDFNIEGVPTVTGAKWRDATIRGMIKNEKYCGDVILQKSITKDEVTFKRQKNKGELPRYYIKDNHPPIVSRDDFELAQKITEQRLLLKGLNPNVIAKQGNRYVFSSKLICGCCGCNFKRVTYNPPKANKYIAWRCNSYTDEFIKGCGSSYIKNNTLEFCFIKMFNRLYSNLDVLLIPYRDYLDQLGNFQTKADIKELDDNMKDLTFQLQIIRNLSTKGLIDTVLLNAQVNEVYTKMNEIKRKKQVIYETHLCENTNLKETQNLIECIKSQPHLLEEMNEKLFEEIIEKVIVHSKFCVTFVLRNGMELKEDIGG